MRVQFQARWVYWLKFDGEPTLSGAGHQIQQKRNRENEGRHLVGNIWSPLR